jgi:beta-lactamase regulating signal transducer with metallopeptidase domain
MPSYADIAPTIDRFSHGLLDTAIRSLVLMVVVSLAVLGMRRASAATRHWAWLMGFVGLLLLPLLSAALPGWRVLPRLGSNPLAANVERPTAIASEQNAPGAVLRDTSSPQVLTHNDASVTNQPQASAPAAASSISVPALSINATPAGQPINVIQQAPALTSPRTAAVAWTFWIALLWLIGCAMVLGHLLLGYLRLWLLQRRCSRINDGQWDVQLNQLRRKLGVRRTVALLSAPGQTMPMTWGIWRARLLLPQEATDWTSEQRHDVLLHELGHVRRFDCAAQLLVQIACAMYWFNPLAWISWNRVQVERERACDDIVLNTGAIATTYARHLLQSATAMPALPFVAPALAMARPSTLESRLRTILDSTRNRGGLSGSATWLTLGLLLIALVPVAALHADENTASSGTPSPGTPAVAGSTGSTVTSSAGGMTPPTPATRPVRPGLLGSRGPGGLAGRALIPPPEMGEGPTCPFSATIYDVRLAPDKIGLIDLDTLDRAAATPAEFEKALAELGASKPLYHTDQTVRLASDSITIGTQTPIITSSHTDANGHAINSLQYQTTGAIFSIAGKSSDMEKIECDLKIELSTVAASSASIAENVKASLFRTSTLSHKGVVDAKKPFVVLSADAASTDENGKAVVYVARITLGAPQ